MRLEDIFFIFKNEKKETSNNGCFITSFISYIITILMFTFLALLISETASKVVFFTGIGIPILLFIINIMKILIKFKK